MIRRPLIPLERAIQINGAIIAAGDDQQRCQEGQAPAPLAAAHLDHLKFIWLCLDFFNEKIHVKLRGRLCLDQFRVFVVVFTIPRNGFKSLYELVKTMQEIPE